MRTIAALLIAACLAQPAAAQTWPQRPVTFIVSQSAGASPDVMARMIATKLSCSSVRPWSSKTSQAPATSSARRRPRASAPDGYTFFFATSAALVTNPYMVKNLSYDPVKDFAPVALVTRSHQVIVVHPDVAAKTLAELIALDKAEPGKISLSVDGPRNLAGVTAQALNKRAGTQFVLVPSVNINNGLQDTITGRTQAGVFSASIVEAQVQERRVARARDCLDAPAGRGARRAGRRRDVAGLRLFRLVHGDGADRHARRYRQEAQCCDRRGTRDPQVRELAPKLGFELDPKGVGTPEAAAAFLKEQLALWAKTTKELGIEPQ